MIWNCKDYNDLSKDELYAILKIRQEVFIIEQNCNYLDADSFDQVSQHLTCYKQSELIAYMRIVPEGEIYPNISFGRILVKQKFRKIGLGKEIIQRAINVFPEDTTIVMSAQLYLTQLYENFGFKITGKEYLEDEIPHIKMIRNE